jgi:nucleotide-binding universal stress UspA family protein
MNQRKILVAVDRSDHALDTIRYVGKTLAYMKIEIVLFYVLNKLPEQLWGLYEINGQTGKPAELDVWEQQEKTATRQFMEKACQILLDEGIPKELMTVNIHEKNVGIARDVIEESRKGYIGVVVGRRGMSRLKDLVLGSIAGKLIEKVDHVPVWVVEGAPLPGKILLALDGSKGAMKAVDYVAATLNAKNTEIILLHVIIDFNIYDEGYIKYFSPEDQKDWVERAEIDMEGVFQEAVNRLLQSGFDEDQLTTKIVSYADSRAGAIVDEARNGGYGTIVMGRRGLTNVKDFFMGRVSNKVIHLAKGLAVWVVS